MSENDFPRTGWVLQPSFKPKEVTLAGNYSEEYIETESGKIYRNSDVYSSKDEAIKGGWERLGIEKSALLKKQVSIEKRGAALRKAESS